MDFDNLVMDGNTALALGAIEAGCRAYFAYPMSPSSGILSYLARIANQTGMLVKQAEDEITAVQMALGASFMGTRSMVATSGGGFDLMVETLSLAGIIESPLVIIIVQRPGPATGLPTWTAQGDVNLAVYGGHGDFPRIVLSVDSVEDCFYKIQEAFDLSQKYQVPVILLTEKAIGESRQTVNLKLGQKPVKQYLVNEKA